MSRLAWSVEGQRVYEVGVDRGVLYTGSGAGVPWNGLVSITESPTGGEPKDYYIDGIKYLSRAASEEFGASIEAFTYPLEFALCDGTAHIKYGLFAAQQNRQQFGLSYRTKLGNDVKGVDYAYKVHLVYNATAQPSSRTRSTIGESVEASLFSWDVTTRAPALRGYNATAHFEIDSRLIPAGLLRRVENILYGTTSTNPRLPDVEELVTLFNTYVPGPDDTLPENPGPGPGGGTGGGPDSWDGGTPTSTYDETVDGGRP